MDEPGRFARDTAVTPLGDGRYAADVVEGWSIARGPNGGYIAALVLRAMLGAVDDPARHPRSFTVHYLSPPGLGPATIDTRVERTGRSMTVVTARLFEDGRLVALGTGAFGPARPGPEFRDRAMPDAPPPDACPPMPLPPPEMRPGPSIIDRWDQRMVAGAPPGSGAAHALAGGWLRLSGAQAVDAVVAAAMTDAWIPSIFQVTGRAGPVPTVDLTVHFRETLPLAGATPSDWVLAMFRTTLVHEGFLEEDGELWSADGRLLAHSRQLAAVL